LFSAFFMGTFGIVLLAKGYRCLPSCRICRREVCAPYYVVTLMCPILIALALLFWAPCHVALEDATLGAGFDRPVRTTHALRQVLGYVLLLPLGHRIRLVVRL
jgi:hypothetical protein